MRRNTRQEQEEAKARVRGVSRKRRNVANLRKSRRESAPKDKGKDRGQSFDLLCTSLGRRNDSSSAPPLLQYLRLSSSPKVTTHLKNMNFSEGPKHRI